MTAAAKFGQEQSGIDLALIIEYAVPNTDRDQLPVLLIMAYSDIDVGVRKQRVDQESISGRDIG